ncbi:MAG: DUF2842 domain-containing protein [Paracoccus sp. (in: a-proteobacteria)]|uniref:DUF2842 domain-containing protein n=1 Tax=Paracoccus sp. TaxID=267 RepID=UPI0039E51407
MTLKSRKRWSLVILLVVLPLYIAAAVTAVNWLDRTFGRQPILVELGVYVVLGILWVAPFRRVFSGVGRGEEPRR